MFRSIARMFSPKPGPDLLRLVLAPYTVTTLGRL